MIHTVETSLLGIYVKEENDTSAPCGELLAFWLRSRLCCAWVAWWLLLSLWVEANTSVRQDGHLPPPCWRWSLWSSLWPSLLWWVLTLQIHVDTLFNHCLRLIFTITTTSLLFLDGIWIRLSTSVPLEPPSVCYLLLVLHSPHTYFLQRKDTISSRILLMLRRCLFATNDLALYAYVHSFINPIWAGVCILRWESQRFVWWCITRGADLD